MNALLNASRRQCGLAALAVLAAACAPTGGPSAAPATVGPLPGDNYAMVYVRDGAVHRLDTRTGLDTALVTAVDTMLLAAASTTGDALGLAYRRSDSTVALIVDVETGSTTQLHTGEAGTSYTGAWSGDGNRFAVGFRPTSGRGGVLMSGEDGSVRSIGCRASDRVEVWRSASQIVVHDDVNFYTVTTDNCSTRARFSKPGKAHTAFAPNGSRVAYFVNRSVRFANRREPQIIPELWVANHDGSNAKVIADYQSRPRNAVLSPDGRRVAYEVSSGRWANTTHVVVYAFATDAYSYIAEEKTLGVPSDVAVCWAPDGGRLAHDRLYARSTGAKAYTTRQVVVRVGDAESVVFEEIVSEPMAQVLGDLPAQCRWIGSRHLLVDSRTGLRVVDVDEGDTWEVPSDAKVLAVKVVKR